LSNIPIIVLCGVVDPSSIVIIKRLNRILNEIDYATMEINSKVRRSSLSFSFLSDPFVFGFGYLALEIVIKEFKIVIVLDVEKLLRKNALC